MGSKTNLELDFVNCCICGDSPSTLLGQGQDYEYKSSEDVFSVVQCDSCSLVYLNPRPAITEFETIYPANYHAFDFSPKQYGIVFKVRERLEANRTLKRCRELTDNARILDVGCGDGFHLNLLKKYGNKNWTLEGIDLDKRAVDEANKSGLKVHLGSVEEMKLPHNTYDLVFMIQTIEHVEKPLKVISSIFNLLKPGGKLVIVTDNTDSLDFKYYKKRYWGGYHFPRQ